MKVESILVHKGREVWTIEPGATIAEAAKALSNAGIGALVVSSDGASIDGILSERDIVRGLAREGATLLDMPVRLLMTSDVTTCGLEDTVADLMATMTEERVRHLPVLIDGRLSGLVSIGDVVKNRVQEIQEEATLLRDYIYSR